MPFGITKNGNNLFVRTLSALLVQTFLISNISFAAPAAKSSDLSIEQTVVTDPAKIVVPRDFGLVKSKFTGTDGRLVIHIQDAHCNYEAQSNIAKIVENLVKNDGLKLVAVEGADGIIDTAWFKAFPDAEVRKEVADYFMKKGEITGPEFLSITTDYNFKLFGAETRAYYLENLNAFTSSYPLKADTEKYFNQIKSVLNRLKALIYNDGLKAMDSKMQEYESKKLQFNDYVRFLQYLAETHKINLRQYDNLFRLINVLIYEKKIDFNVTDRERSALVDELNKRIDKDTLKELVANSLSFKVGKISSAEFYAYLKALAIKNNIDMQKDYPNLYNYIIYNSVYSRIENEELFRDIKLIESAVKEKLFQNDDQRTLERLSRHIDTLLGLVNIKLLNGDFEYFKTHKEEFAPAAFTEFIQKKTTQFGLSYDIEQPSDAVASSISKLEDFYAIAIKRDRALVDNTLAQMTKDRQKVAVLITGGFHSEGISKLLEKQGISHMVVCPSITKDVPSPYIQILTNQRTPLEDILVGTAHAKENDALAPPSRIKIDKGLLKDYAEKVLDGRNLVERIESIRDEWAGVFINGVDDPVISIHVGGYLADQLERAGAQQGISTRDLLLIGFEADLKNRCEELEREGVIKKNSAGGLARSIMTQVKEKLSSTIVDEFESKFKERLAARRAAAERAKGVMPASPGIQASASDKSTLNEKQNDAFNSIIKQSFKDGTYIELSPALLGFQGPKDFKLVIHAGLEKRIEEYNRLNPGTNLPVNRICPGRGGDMFEHKLRQAHLSLFQWLMLMKLIPPAEKVQEVASFYELLETVVNHEGAHIKIANGELRNMTGRGEETFVDSLPGCNISKPFYVLNNKSFRQWLAEIDLLRESDDNSWMSDAEDLMLDSTYGTAVRDTLMELFKNGRYEEARGLTGKIKAIRDRINYARSKVLVKTGYEGYDVIIISSTTPEEADHQRKAMEALFNGVKTRNSLLGNEVCILSILDRSEGGQLVGQAYTWHQAVIEFEKWKKSRGIHNTTSLNEISVMGGAKIVTYHNGGKGERFSPGSQVYSLSRADQDSVGSVPNAEGKEVPINLLSSVILTTSEFARGNDGSRIDVFWTNQIGIPTTDLPRSNCQLDKAAIAIPVNPDPKDLHDYGTLIVDKNGKMTDFLANKKLTRKARDGRYERNPEYGAEYDRLMAAAKEGRAFFDFGPFSITSEMHNAVYQYWKNKLGRLLENNEKFGKSRDIDPAFIQILVPLVNGLQAIPDVNIKAMSLDSAYEEILRLMTDEYRRVLKLRYEDNKENVLDCVAFFIANMEKPFFSDLSAMFGHINLGVLSHWFPCKRLLDTANDKFLMLSDINGAVMQLDGSGAALRKNAEGWDKVKAEDARRLRGIKAGEVARFKAFGKDVTLSIQEMREGRFITVSGEKKKEKGKPEDGIWVKGSIIQGDTNLYACSSIENSVVNNTQGIVIAANSYVERATSPVINAENSIVIKRIDERIIEAKRQIVADAYRPEVKDPRFRFAGGKITMTAPIGYDPKPPYTKIGKDVDVEVEDKDGAKRILHVDGSSDVYLDGIRLGRYNKAVSCTAGESQYPLTDKVWRDDRLLDAVLCKDTLLLNEDPGAKRVMDQDQVLTKNIRSAFEQGEYYADDKGGFIAKPESDYRVIEGNTFAFHAVRLMPCNRTENDRIESDMRQKVLRDMDARIALFVDRTSSFKPVKFGTSGLRGESEDLNDREVYINILGLLEYFRDLPNRRDLPNTYMMNLIKTSGGRTDAFRSGSEVAIAGDYRDSTSRLLVDLALAIKDAGYKVNFAGIIPSPELANYGINVKRIISFMVTGSHNPPSQNGVKPNSPLMELLKLEEALVAKYIERVRCRLYVQTGDEGIFNEKDGMLRRNAGASSVSEARIVVGAKDGKTDESVVPKTRKIQYPDGTSEDLSEPDYAYIERYVDAFGRDKTGNLSYPLRGKNIIFWEQSTVGRNIWPKLLKALGANVIFVEKSDKFVQVDTENMDERHLEALRHFSQEYEKNYGRKPFAVITCDGDADRPVFCDENGTHIYGDVSAMMASLYLGAEFIAAPATSNNKGVEMLRGRGIRFVKTDIGSPYVIEAGLRARERELGRSERERVKCAFEVNGGFLALCDIRMRNGATLTALPTRDAATVMIANMLYAIESSPDGTISGLVNKKVFADGMTYTPAGLVQNTADGVTPGCENYTREVGPAIVAEFSPGDKDILYVKFEGAGRVLCIRSKIKELAGNERLELADDSLAKSMEDIRRRILPYVKEIEDKDVEMEGIEYITGIRVFLTNGDIITFRPSGNAAQFRIYIESKDMASAKEMVKRATRPTSGVLVNMIRSYVYKTTRAKFAEESPVAVPEKPVMPSPGIYAASAQSPEVTDVNSDAVNRILEERSTAIDNIFAGGAENEYLYRTSSIANNLNGLYASLKNANDRARFGEFLRAFYSDTAKRALEMNDAEMSRGLQIIAGQSLALLNLIDQAVPGVEHIRLTADMGKMLKAEDKDRGPSYIDAASVTDSGLGIAKKEGDGGVYWRGVEGLGKLGNNIVDEMIWSPETFRKFDARILDNPRKEQYVMYLMLHVNGYHTTVFLHDTLPGSVQHTSTGAGHLQIAKNGKFIMDLKQVTRGTGIQYSKVYDESGRLINVIEQRLEPGVWFVAIPGTVDAIDNTGGLEFNDFSFEVSDERARDIMKGYISLGVDLDKVRDARAVVEGILTSKEEKAASSQVPLVTLKTKNGPVLLEISPVSVSTVSNFTKLADNFYTTFVFRGEGSWGQSIRSDTINPLKVMLAMRERDRHALPAQTSSADVYLAQAVNDAKVRNIAESGMPIVSAPDEFDAGRDKAPVKTYAWGGRAIAKLLEWKDRLVAEIWFNSTQKDGLSRIPGTNIPLEEAIAANPEAMLGKGMQAKPIFSKILGPKEDQPRRVYLGFNGNIIGNEAKFVDLAIRERELMAQLNKILSGLTKPQFEEYEKAYTAWVNTQTEQGWNENSIPALPNFMTGPENKNEVFVKIRQNRKELVSYLNPIGLMPGQAIISPVGYIHSIVGSFQLHPPSTHPEAKNEAWYVFSTGISDEKGRDVLLYFEPQQTSNTTYSPFDFASPITWSSKYTHPDLRKDLTQNLGAILEEGQAAPKTEAEAIRLMLSEPVVKFAPSKAEDFIVSTARSARPASGALYEDAVNARATTLITGTYPVWPKALFTLDRVALEPASGIAATITINPVPESFSELTVLKGEVQVKIGQKTETLKPGASIFVPANHKGPIMLSANVGSEVVRLYPPAKPADVKAGSAVSREVSKMTAEELTASVTIPDKEAFKAELAKIAGTARTEKGVVIVAYDIKTSKTADTQHVALEAQNLTDLALGEGAVIGIRGTGEGLLDDIMAAQSDLAGRGIKVLSVVTIAGDVTMNGTTKDGKIIGEELKKLHQKSTILDIYNPDGRFISVPALYDLAIRIAYERSDAELLECMSRVGLVLDGSDNPMDLKQALMRRIIRILPRARPVDTAAEVAAHKAAKAALHSV